VLVKGCLGVKKIPPFFPRVIFWGFSFGGIREGLIPRGLRDCAIWVKEGNFPGAKLGDDV